MDEISLLTLNLAKKYTDEHGGGGGTTNYNQLTNKPQIAGTELQGNKSLADLGIASAQSVSNITNGERINTFAGVETALDGVGTALALKQNATDNSLETDDKTIVGAINEHEGDVASLKSGFTNLDNEVNGDATTYPYADVITIEDAVPANLADCSVKIEPVQDLHGYDKPWVGGAGKNKLPLVLADIKTLNTIGTWSGNVYTVNSVSFTVLTDSDGNITGININGSTSSRTQFGLYSGTMAAGSYVFNGCPSGGSGTTYQQFANAGGSYYLDRGIGASFTLESDTSITVDIDIHNVSNFNQTFYPMLRLATETDATFAPYTNLCPISGHTEASVQRDGKNLFDKSNTTSGYINGNNGEASDSSPNWEKSEKIYVHPNTQYIISVDSAMSSSTAGLAFYDKDDNYISGIVYSSVGWLLENSRYYQTLTSPSNAAYAKLTCKLNDENRLMFARGTVTAYTPYIAPHTYTIALGDTIYGGTVDFDSGVMTVDRAFVEYNGTQTSQNVQRIDNVVRGQYVIQNSATYPQAISNYLEWVNDWGLDQPHFYIYDNKINVFLPIPNDGTSTWDSYLASNPLQVCYYLATPTTIQLTPQQIQLLKGQNTLYASTGQISVTANGVSGSIGSVQEQVNGLAEDVAEIKPVDYSTTEQATGRKWLNKPTYIVVIDMGEEKTVTSNAWYTVGNHLGAETIVNGIGISGGGGTIPMQIVEDTNDGIKILQTRNAQVGVRYVWLEYTKTT